MQLCPASAPLRLLASSLFLLALACGREAEPPVIEGDLIRLVEHVAELRWEIPPRSSAVDVVDRLEAADFRIQREALDSGRCHHFDGFRDWVIDSWLCRTEHPPDPSAAMRVERIQPGGRLTVLRPFSPKRGREPDVWQPADRGIVLQAPSRGVGAPAPADRVVVSYLVDRSYLERIDRARSSLADHEFVARNVEIDGDLRPALYAAAPARHRARVRVPERGRLLLAIGVMPEGHLLSDGMQFVAKLRVDEEETLLLSEHLDPRENPLHRRWLEFDLDLSEFGGRVVELSMETLPGPSGESGYDLGVFGNPLIYNESSKRTPVILLDLDTLRADHLQTYGYPLETSPVIQAFSEEAVVFDQAIAQAPWTLASQVSLFTGLYPASHGVHRLGQNIAASVTTLASELQRNGWLTKAITDNHVMSSSFGFNRGFDSFHEQRGLRGVRHDFISDLMRRLRSWMDSWRPGQLMLLLHTYEPHHPYIGAPEDMRRFVTGYLGSVYKRFNRFTGAGTPGFSATPEETAYLIARYDAGIRTLDRAVGEIFDLLRARGLYENSVIVLVSDHGEEFGVRKAWTHGGTFADDVIRAPLMIRFPKGTIAPRRVAQQVELIDVMPTLLEFLELPIPANLDGQSMLSLIRSAPGGAVERRWQREHRFAIADVRDSIGYAVRSSTHKLTGQPGELHFYSLESDPDELNDLYDPDDPLIREFEEALAKYLSKDKSDELDESGVEISKELEERLRTLGYTQ